MKDLTVFEVDKYKTYDKNGNLNEGIREIDINEVTPNPDQPRKNFDPEAIKELSKTIKKYGLIQPIIAILDRNKYVIVAGERRYRAAQLAGLKTVPVIVKNLTRKQIDEIALIENIQRQNLNAIEEANAYKKFIDDYSLTQEELAKNIGKSRVYVTNSMRLLGLPEEVKKMVEMGRLSAGHARALLGIDDEMLQITMAKAACDKQMSVRQVEILVHNKNNPKDKKKAKPILSIELKQLVRTMERVFATHVTLQGNDQKGRFYIDYYTPDDLERIIELIEKLRKDSNL